ncbi:MAG: hypothetical protein IT209_05395 [Armatimonadetes bacterium]|nr:hypothetical protein [Armatimonadota bacterium]
MKARLLFVTALLALSLLGSVSVVAQNLCCVNVTPGAAQPPDHTWHFDPANPDQPNLMMHAKLCLSCPPGVNQPINVTGLRLTASGTGNDATDIQAVRITYDVNCNGVPDSGDPVITVPGGYPVDNGTLTVCNPTLPFAATYLTTDRCICLLIEYVLKPDAPCGATYQFAITSILQGPNCQPYPLCNPNAPFKSAIKTVECDQPCCLEVSYGPKHPADHDFQCVPGTVNAPNFMMQAQVCNPCPTPQPISGLILKAFGSGNDVAGIQQVLVAIDKDCDGNPDTALISAGAYTADDGTLTFCSSLGPIYTLAPGQCVCINIYYQMRCPTPPGQYCFELDAILGPNCQPICANVLPLKSACKNVEDCCLQVQPGPHNPGNHTFTCTPGQNPERNFMQEVRICNPCDTYKCIDGLKLVANGTGNDLTGIAQVLVSIDYDCDGKADTAPRPIGTYSSDNGTLSWCGDPATGPLACLEPGQCVCIRIEYQMNCNAPPGTYSFTLQALLGGPNCEPLCANTLPIPSATKTVVRPCCLEVSKGPKSPPDHNFICTPNNPLNFMGQVRICNPCPTPQPVYGLSLQAFGSGNDLAGISSVIVAVDRNCDGVIDGPSASGIYSADNGTASICLPTAPLYVLQPGECICLNVYYRMKCPNVPPGTYGFAVTGILGSNCKPVCAGPLPIRSSIKTVTTCCLTAVKGDHNPPDHTFQCSADGLNAPNFMQEVRVCNPCPTTQCVYGLRLHAGGTGNDATGIQKVLISLDYNCDGKPDAVNIASGQYGADNGLLVICSPTGGPLFCLQPGQCVCIRVDYIMTCPVVPGTYYFDLISLGGPGCDVPLCVETLPIRSAVKTIETTPCCLEVGLNGQVPDHDFVCPPGGDPALNLMQKVRICNPCPDVKFISGVMLKAFGTGNDQSGISAVVLQIDRNCDGQPETPPITLTGAYSSDNGIARLCSPNGVIALKPGECVCFNFYYMMKCPNPGGTYGFVLTDILGPNCEPICANTLPLTSAIKIVSPEPCCLDIRPGPNNPPNHKWWPGLPKRNRMFQFQICNPCPQDVRLGCIQLQACGSGNDKKDIALIRVIADTNCNGVADFGEPVFGTGTYPSDNGTAVICPSSSFILPPGTAANPSCMCFLVEYIMKLPGTINGTYCMTLTQVSAVNMATGADVCKTGLPLQSNTKKRCLNIGHVKFLPVGTVVCLPNKVITAAFPDRFYISELYRGGSDVDPDTPGVPPDRSAGIAVLGPVQAGPMGGMEVDVEGVVDVVGCEVVVVPTSIAYDGEASVLPLGMNNKTTGGETEGNQSAVIDSFFDVFYAVGLNNVGSLVRTWGTVTGIDPVANAVWIDDGSNLKDGTHSASGELNRGVKVDLSMSGIAAAQIPVGAYLHVTGIMSTDTNMGVCIRKLIPRGRTDVKIEAGPALP